MVDKIGTAVRIEIIEIMGCGKCPSGFEVGQTWIVSDGLCTEGMCEWAFNAILPFITTLRFGGRFPWRGRVLTPGRPAAPGRGRGHA